MTDQEIYELASSVVGSIVSDLSEGIYAELGGSLMASWSTEPKVAAWAASLADPKDAPEHRVVMCYELVRQLYRNTEEYHKFATDQFLEDQFQIVFRDYDPLPRLAEHIPRENSIRNMFIGALTWVFFHEIGHLVQEHGYIRTTFGGTEAGMDIEDCESDGNKPLEGRASVISHVTEFAADVEATQWCVGELVRHFVPKLEDIDEHALLEFRSNLYLMVSGISCAFYLFHGQRSAAPTSFPYGSHPTPIRRLEVCLPNVFEKLDFGGRGEKFHGLSRAQLVYLCTGAAYSAAFYWLWRYAKQPGIPEHFMPKGLLQDPFRVTYWGAIVAAWDEIEPAIQEIRRFGSKLGVLDFTATFRSQVFGLDDLRAVPQGTPLPAG